MQTVFATAAGNNGRANEDYAVCGPGWAMILDGATAPDGVDSGCVHDVPWLVRHLAANMTRQLALDDGLPLPEILASAIRSTCEAHAGTCDLANPDSPSSTAAIIRARGDVLDFLVLGDSPVILWRGREAMPVIDDRLDHLPGGRPYSLELVRRERNAPGGFWVASTHVQSAYEAISGSAEGITEAAMLTDGVTRLTESYGWTWADVLAVLRHEGGPSGLIRRVRQAEEMSPPERGKCHDDATAVYASEVHQTADTPVVPDPLILSR